MKLTSLTISALAIGSASATGTIRCKSGSLNGGRGNVPTHSAIYSFDNGQTFFCDAIAGACGQVKSLSDLQNTYVTCSGDKGGTQKAAFWVTKDGCYNICSGGNHMYCCGADSNSGGTCHPTSFGPGC